MNDMQRPRQYIQANWANSSTKARGAKKKNVSETVIAIAQEPIQLSPPHKSAQATVSSFSRGRS